ncbi:hypothetical protein LCGC14_0814960 [marine sediment metagenome]|uniref:Radical SAM core domain-containing protein n=1 Tax=marine sediment metagenome TaxID=412755 RepID=A0A0F9S5J4_9ZZZZ
MRNNCRVVLTDRCNLDCSFCCMKDKRIYYSFTNQTALWIAQQRYDEIAITGGEPLMELEKLVQFICLVKYFNPDAKMYLYTNGMSLNYYEAFTLKTAGLTGVNWSPKEKPNSYYQEKMTFIHVCLIPIRILIQDRLMDDDILQFALNNNMQIRQWTIGDCDDMKPEDRFRIDWSNV